MIEIPQLFQASHGKYLVFRKDRDTVANRAQAVQRVCHHKDREAQCLLPPPTQVTHNARADAGHPSAVTRAVVGLACLLGRCRAGWASVGAATYPLS